MIIRRVVSLWPITLFAACFFPQGSRAQTTYTVTNPPYLCKAASAQPVYPFQNFMCWGIPISDGSGNTGTFYFMGSGRVEVYLPTIDSEALLGTLSLTRFTPTGEREACNGTVTGNTPGTFTFDWTATDSSGVTHTGSVSATWIDKQMAGGRGCYWHAPKLLTFSTTVQP